MKFRVTRLLFVLLLPVLVFGQNAAGTPPAKAGKNAKPPPPPSLAKVAWLAGNWRMEKAGRVVEEQWMAPAGGVMLGMGRTVAKGRLVEYEFVQIREGPGGDLFYIAEPSGQKLTTFKIIASTDNTVVFENKEHDFPQTVGYELKPDGTLLAYIEGPAADGTAKRIEFLYQRVP